MLVLKRKVGETVMLGDSIEVQVLAVEGDTVKLGFVAPSDVQILRKELFEGIMRENMVAGRAIPQEGKQIIGLLNEFKDAKIKIQRKEE
jgi:carbon storage regulator